MQAESSGAAKPTAAVIPALDEEIAIFDVVSSIRSEIVSETIVVDGGSKDRTVDVAERAGAKVVTENRPGYGRACATGVLHTDCEIIVFLDGDGSDDGSALGQIVDPIVRDEADLVLGSRLETEPGALPFYARLGNSLAAWMITALWRQRISDLPSCKAIRRRDLVDLQMTEATYGWTIEMIVKAARRGLRIREVPLRYARRVGGESKVSGNALASIKAAFAILRVLARHSLRRSDGIASNQAVLVRE